MTHNMSAIGGVRAYGRSDRFLVINTTVLLVTRASFFRFVVHFRFSKKITRFDEISLLICHLLRSQKLWLFHYVDKILVFFDHLPPCVNIFYDMNVDKKKWKF